MLCVANGIGDVGRYSVIDPKIIEWHVDRLAPQASTTWADCRALRCLKSTASACCSHTPVSAT
jgi:hypothetical protein